MPPSQNPVQLFDSMSQEEYEDWQPVFQRWAAEETHAGPRANHVPWSEKTQSQREELRRQWKFADDFYGRPQPIDLIRLAFMQDLGEMVSGADIWRPR